MEAWNEIINTAMLGTGKKLPAENLLPQDIAELLPLLQQQTTDKEEQFLQTASLVFNYRQCGNTPVKKVGISIPLAPPEEKPFCSPLALQVVKDILEEESYSLLTLWLNKCNEKQKIVQPEVIPQLLYIAIPQKKLRTAIVSCCGKKGQWLCQFNTDWNFTTATTDEETWQTGTLEQRKQVLGALRENDPALALEWLQKTWSQEDANTKTELVQLLQANISINDIAFLESLSGEKSKKVKDMAFSLLKKIPQSAIVQQYAAIVKEAIQVKKEKALLGLSSKVVLQVQLPAIDESIFKTGIEKLSSKKEISDDLHIVYQLLQHIPLTLLEDWWQLKPEEIIALFQKDNDGQKLIGALINSCVNFNDHRWAIFFMQYSAVFYLDLLPLLPPQQQEYYSNKFFKGHEDSVLYYAVRYEREWSPELARNIFKYTSKNFYQYNRSFYNQHIHLIPVQLMNELDGFAESDDVQGHWQGISDYIRKLLNLKAQVYQSFA